MKKKFVGMLICFCVTMGMFTSVFADPISEETTVEELGIGVEESTDSECQMVEEGITYSDDFVYDDFLSDNYGIGEDDVILSEDGAVGLDGISFTSTNIYNSESYTFNGADGKAAIIICGGPTTCYNTKSALSSVTELMKEIDSSKLNVYVIDLKKASTSQIKEVITSSGWYTGAYYDTTTVAEANTLYRACRKAAGIEDGQSITMPLIVYKGSDGIVKYTSTNYVSGSVIRQNLISMGLLVNDTTSTSMEVIYEQEDARKMVDLVNEFRASSTWYWNSDNTSKTYVSDLPAVTYDYNLEKIAMQRAAEIAYVYANTGVLTHTRPNGDKCFTAFDYTDYPVCVGRGENIAAGHSTKEIVFDAWKEENKTYSGQGHRRIMLNKNFTNFAVGHCTYNGKQFWVQLFTKPASESTGDPTWANETYLADVKIYTKGNGALSISQKEMKGWFKIGTKWRYYTGNKSYYKSAFADINGYRYYFDADGSMVTGWQTIDSNKYYFETSGTMAKSKWINETYYVKDDGTMAINEWVDGGRYYVGADGKRVAVTSTPTPTPATQAGGWKQDANGWWYQHSDGTCTRNGWESIDGKWYHFDSVGYMQTGWLESNGKWYYLENSGVMATSKWVGNYYLKEDGTMATNEWIGKYYVDGSGKWDPNKGASQGAWKKNSAGWWYLNSDGSYPMNCWAKIDDKWYHFNGSGYMQTGWLKVGGKWYYLKSSGEMATGWIKINGKDYYLYSDGHMAANEWIGKYHVNGSGVWDETK